MRIGYFHPPLGPRPDCRCAYDQKHRLPRCHYHHHHSHHQCPSHQFARHYLRSMQQPIPVDLAWVQRRRLHRTCPHNATLQMVHRLRHPPRPQDLAAIQRLWGQVSYYHCHHSSLNFFARHYFRLKQQSILVLSSRPSVVSVHPPNPPPPPQSHAGKRGQRALLPHVLTYKHETLTQQMSESK